MPFTLSHPALVVPLSRRGLPLSALAIGSMAPDFPYFLLPSGRSEFSHSWQGILLVGLPVGLVVLWLYHNALKWPLLSLLPEEHRVRLAPSIQSFSFKGWRRLLLICFSLLIGGYSHLAWDLLTHFYGWEFVSHLTNWSRFAPYMGELYENFPDFHQPIATTPRGDISIFDILQNGSSLLGILLLAFWYRRWFRRTPAGTTTSPFEIPETVRRRCLVLMSVGLLIAFGCGLVESYYMLQPEVLSDWTQGVARQTIVFTLKVGLAELTVFCLLWQLGFRKARRAGGI